MQSCQAWGQQLILGKETAICPKTLSRKKKCPLRGGFARWIAPLSVQPPGTAACWHSLFTTLSVTLAIKDSGCPMCLYRGNTGNRLKALLNVHLQVLPLCFYYVMKATRMPVHLPWTSTGNLSNCSNTTHITVELGFFHWGFQGYSFLCYNKEKINYVDYSSISVLP